MEATAQKTSRWTEKDRKRLLLDIVADYRQCERSFFHFVKRAWPEIRAEPFQENWHHKAFCNHLEAAYEGRIRRLIINVPPRSTKTTIISILFPAWVWTKSPEKQFLCLSRSKDVATDSSRDCRQLIKSTWYQRYWGQKVQLLEDQDVKTRFANSAGGKRVALPMLSKGQGEDADFTLIDDPNDLDDMWSEAARTAVQNAYDQKWSSRHNNPKTGVTIIVQQRVHLDDLTGHTLRKKKAKWEILKIPFKFDPNHRCKTSIGYKDPRKKRGSYYFPARFGKTFYDERVEDFGPAGASAQLEQAPVPQGGGMCPIDKLKRYKVLPDPEKWTKVVQTWDTAQTDQELINDPWVCITWVQVGNDYYLKEVYRAWHRYPEGRGIVVSLANREKPSVIVIENKSTGASLLQECPSLCKWSFMPWNPKGSKFERFDREMPAVHAGRVHIPEVAEWLPTFLNELAQFGPTCKYKDQGDAFSMGLAYFRQGAQPIGWVI